MLRATVFVFVTGWILWFWLDKPPLPSGLPGGENQLIANFQFTFNLLKQGYVTGAYAFIWRAHYLLLSLLGGLLVSMLVAGVSRALARRRYSLRTRQRADVVAKPEPPGSKQDL